MKCIQSAGLAIAMLGASMASPDAQALGWPQPSTPCNQSNAWAIENIQYINRWNNLTLTYQCDPDFGWTLIMVCDNKPGGICEAY